MKSLAAIQARLLLSALTEQTREREPLGWASIQTNLGIALASLGERVDDSARLWQSVEAYGEALKEQTPESAPYDRVLTEIHLGLALWHLSDRDNSPVLREKAIETSRLAIEHDAGNLLPYASLVQKDKSAPLKALKERIDLSAQPK